MMFPPLSDVFFPARIHEELGIHYKERDEFARIPAVSGVYAWFYPLLITSKDLDECLDRLRQVHLYDAHKQASPILKHDKRLGWSLVTTTIEFKNPPQHISPSMQSIWKESTQDDARFDKLQRVFLRASLLMPPLYVGKARVLSERCQDHIGGASGFAKRYGSRAKELRFHSREVSDLILVTLNTSSVEEEEQDMTEGLVEKILNLVARPPYGKI
jgi:hypothetical protein